MRSRLRSTLAYDLGRLVPNAAKPPLWALYAVLLWLFFAIGLVLSMGWVYIGLMAFAALGATAGTLNSWRLRHERARSKLLNDGICPRCRYDLRATTGDRCTECGYWLGVRRRLTRRSDAVDDRG